MIPNAAAVIPRLPDGRVLVGVRTHSARSWPGTLAFPGGAIDDDDVDMPLLVGDVDLQERAARAGALREAWEEAGLVRVAGRDGSRLPDAVRAQLIADVRAGKSVADALRAHDAALDDRDMTALILWRVPTGRFTVRQFLLELDDADLDAPLSDELADVDFRAPARVLDAWTYGETFLLPPIHRVMTALVASASHNESAAQRVARLRAPQHAAETHALRPVAGVAILASRTPTLPPATHTNAVLLEKRWLVDPATPYAEEQAAFDATLADLLGDEKLEAIICTHHHHDHVGDVARLARKHGVPVWAHAETQARVDFAVDRVLVDGEALAAGVGWRAVHTPGHAIDHLCFFHAQQGVLVAGDMIAGVGSILIDPPDGHMATYLASMARLADLHPRLTLPSHGPFFVDGETALRAQIAHREQRAQAIAQAIDAGAGDVGAVVAAVYGADTPVAMHALAARSVLASVHLLQERGVITEKNGAWVSVRGAS